VYSTSGSHDGLSCLSLLDCAREGEEIDRDHEDQWSADEELLAHSVLVQLCSVHPRHHCLYLCRYLRLPVPIFQKYKFYFDAAHPKWMGSLTDFICLPGKCVLAKGVYCKYCGIWVGSIPDVRVIDPQ
jgi:hypothetical protein